MRSLTSFTIAILLFGTIMLPGSSTFLLGGGNLFGCCIVPCPPPTPACDCSCGLPQLPFPQLPPLLPTLAFPQFPTFSGGAYATPGGGNAVKQQFDNNYLQQPSSYQLPQGISNQQQPPANQGAGIYGFGVTQYEQQQPGGGYAIGSGLYGGAQNGAFGDSSPYNVPRTTENRFGGPLPPQPASGMGQYLSGPPPNAPLQSEAQNISTGATAGVNGGTEYQAAPNTSEYVKKRKAFVKVHKS